MRNLFLLIPLLSLIACQGDDITNAAEIANEAAIANSGEVEANEAVAAGDVSAPSPAKAEVGPLQIHYDAAMLTPVETRLALPPDWTAEVDALKLIARDRAALIGRAECMYGQSGQASRCNVVQEAGLSFAVIDQPYDAMRARLPADQLKPVMIADTEGVSWLIGAEGEGAEHILLPAGERTALIVRQFRNSGNPDETAIGTVLNDLRLNDSR